MSAPAPSVVAAVGALALALCACGDTDNGTSATSGNAQSFPMTVRSCDAKVTLERPPERVLAQGPEAPVLIAAAGAADRLVAINDLSDVPLGRFAQPLRGVPRIGKPGQMLSREAVIAERPNLVINRGPGNDLPAGSLSGAGIATLVVSGRCETNTTGIRADGSFDQIYSDVGRFGRMFGTEPEAREEVSALRRRVATVERQATRVRPGVTGAAVYIAGGTVYTYGNLATINTQMTTLGLRNVFGKQAKRYIETSLESVIARKPDVLVVLYEQGAKTPRQVAALPQLANLRAIREGRVLGLPFGQSIDSPLAVDGLQHLAKELSTCGTPPAAQTTPAHHRCP